MKSKNVISKILFIIGIAVMVISFFIGILAGSVANAFIFWVSGFISGMIVIGFAEVIHILDEINNKIKDKTPHQPAPMKISKSSKYKVEAIVIEEETIKNQIKGTLFMSIENFFFEDQQNNILFEYPFSKIIDTQEVLNVDERFITIKIRDEDKTKDIKLQTINPNNSEKIIEIIEQYKIGN